MASLPFALTSASHLQHQRTPSAFPHLRSATLHCRSSASELHRGIGARFWSSCEVSRFSNGNCNSPETAAKVMLWKPQSDGVQWKCFHGVSATGGESSSITGMFKESENLVFGAVNMNFFERLSLAWRILFPTHEERTSARNSNANIAKQRLKMILFSDRCAVTEEAKQKIVSNIVTALSDFVEIDSRDKVQLSVSADPDLGTVYSVAVPIRRVKPEYQEVEEEYSGIANIVYKDAGETSGTVDVRFEFAVPNKE